MKKILAIRNDRFGEFLLNIPAFRALKNSFPGAELTLLVNPAVRELAECVEFADEVMAWENRRHTLAELWAFSRRLKEKRFDLCLIFNPCKELNLLSFFAGIPKRVGYDRKWGFLLTRGMPDKKYLARKHEIEYNLELAALAGAKGADQSLTLRVSNGIIRNLPNKFPLSPGKDFIVIHPWASDPLKVWGLENFQQLAQKAALELNLKVMIIGGGEEARNFPGGFRWLGINIIDLVGRTSLCELAALLRQARMLVSGDSGPVHLASAMGVPALVLFRNDLPGKTAVRWGPKGAGSLVMEGPDLSKISVEEVFVKLKGALAG